MSVKTLKEKWKAGELTLGAFMFMSSPTVTELMAQFEFDWIIIDGEHTPTNDETHQVMLQAMNGSGIPPIVRIGDTSSMIVKKMLDLGYAGVMFPMVNTAEEARRAVRYTKYPPEGERGFGPIRASRYFLELKEYVLSANDEVMALVQIEHAESVENIDAICAVEGIEAGMVGIHDLAASMGHLMDPGHPEVEKAIETVAARMRESGIAPGILVTSLDEVAKREAQGYQMIIIMTDVGVLGAGTRAILEKFGRGVRPGG